MMQLEFFQATIELTPHCIYKTKTWLFSETDSISFIGRDFHVSGREKFLKFAHSATTDWIDTLSLLNL